MLKLCLISILFGCCYSQSCQKNEDSTYKLVTEKKSWTDARSYCQGSTVLGASGDLIVDDNAVSNAYVDAQSSRLWLGASDLATEGTWLWVNGEPVIPATGGRWAPGEPNNGRRHRREIRSGQHCMVGNYLGHQWDDQSPSVKYAFVCEYPLTGYIRKSGRLLKYYSVAETFSSAKQTCESIGGLLVVADNAEINTAISEQSGPHWIGASQQSESEWQWTNGDTVGQSGFENWASGDQTKLCVITNNGLWEEASCDDTYPFYCQLEDTAC